MRNIFSQKPDMDGLENPSAAPAGAAAEGAPAGESRARALDSSESKARTLDGAGDSTAPDFAATQDGAFAALNAECLRLEKEVAEHRDNLLRRQAEFDNFRRRTERERAEFRVSATMDAVTNMLPVLDGLEAALKAPVNTGAAEMRKGVELVEKQMRETLEKMGMARVDALGKPFDPRLHHAVEMVPSDSDTDQTVIGVFQQGYLFQDRLLRPAMVKVASRNSPASPHGETI
jgi:molecular chaperone GrpE